MTANALDITTGSILSRIDSYPQQAQDDIRWLIDQLTGVDRNSVISTYTEEFERAFAAYPIQSNKWLSFVNWRKLMLGGIPECVLTVICHKYAKDMKARKMTLRYIMSMASLLDPEKRKYEDYLAGIPLDPTKEPDWCKSSGKLLRDMQPYELIQHGYTYPLPVNLDYSRNFGVKRGG